MEEEGFRPDERTYVALVSACERGDSSISLRRHVI